MQIKQNQYGYKLTIIKYDDLIDIYRGVYLTSVEYTIFFKRIGYSH